MSYLVLGFNLLLLWVIWGLGLALWILPLGWRRCIWSLCIPFGISFQVAVVWWISMAGATVEKFGIWVNLIPVATLGAAFLRKDLRRLLGLMLRTRMAVISPSLATAALLLALLPAEFSKFHPAEFTTFSFGSCDAPDYVMGARLFLEKGRQGHGGFWSQTEVHQLGPGMTLWKYWTRLNHFGPAALMALISATLRVPLWQIGTTLAAALGASVVPLVLGFSRYVIRLSWGYSVSVTILYLGSPLWLYAVYHVALGQIAGAAAVSSCLLLAAQPSRMRSRVDVAKCMVAAAVPLWLLCSSYAFMLLFVVLVAIGVGIWRAVSKRSLSILKRLIIGGAGASFLCTCLFPTRVWGFLQSVLFFGGGTFGWSIGPMQLQTVIGLPADMALNPLEADTSIPILIAFGALWIWGVVNAWHRRDAALPMVIVTSFVILGISYWMVELDPTDARLTSYKAYKLVAVFLPVLLPGLFIGLKYPILTIQRFVNAGLIMMVAMFLPRPLSQMWKTAEFMPLRVAPGFFRLSEEEKNPNIQAVNILPVSTWTRLWVSAFLANKREYFADSTYVSRAATTLGGDWDIRDDLPGLYPPQAKHFGNRVVLMHTSEKALVLVSFGMGWWQDEEAHRWSGAAGRSFVVHIDSLAPLEIDLEMDGVFNTPGTKLRAFIGQNEIHLDQERGYVHAQRISLSVGRTELRFQADRSPELSRNKQDLRRFLYKMTKLSVTRSR